jgi:hypothetical protein
MVDNSFTNNLLNKNKYRLNFLINSLFIIVLLSSFTSTKSQVLSQDYTLLFELDDSDLTELDRFEDLFEFNLPQQDLEDSDNNDDEVEFTNQISEVETKNSITYYADASVTENGNSYSIQNNDDVDEYIRENEDYIDDLTYVENIDTIRQIQNEDLNLNSQGYLFRKYIAKIMVHNAFRNSPIYYSQDISV